MSGFEYFLWVCAGALIAGTVCGIMPYAIAVNKDRYTFAKRSMAICIVSGLLYGVLLALPVAVVLSLYVIYSKKGGK